VAIQRTLLLDTPGRGLTLRVKGRKGRHTTIEMLVYRAGAKLVRRMLHVKLTGATTIALRIPSYGGAAAEPKPKLTIAARPNGHGGLSITARAPVCRGSIDHDHDRRRHPGGRRLRADRS
jgi:hypothetical protein